MCAQDNMTVAHAVDAGVVLPPAALAGHSRPHRKPLVVFTPKSMLRLKAAASAAEDFTSGTFRPVIGDDAVDPAGVRRVLLCSGQGLLRPARRARSAAAGPTSRSCGSSGSTRCPSTELTAALAPYPRDAELVWVQEEPANQGAWPFVALNLPDGRRSRAAPGLASGGRLAPAVGTHKVHEREQAELVARRASPEGPACTSPTAASRSSRSRRGEEEVTFAWLAERLRTFVDLHPEFEIPVERLAIWLARLDDDEDPDLD